MVDCTVIFQRYFSSFQARVYKMKEREVELIIISHNL